MGLPHEFFAHEDLKTWTLESRVDGEASSSRAMKPSHIWLTPRRGVLSVLHAIVARGLRWSGSLLVLSPIFALPFVFFAHLAPGIASMVVVVFVVTAVTFFGLLNAFVLIAVLRHMLSRHLAIRLWSADDDDQQEAVETLGLIDAPSFTGRILSIGAPIDGAEPTTVVRALLSRAQGVHHISATDFALEDDHGDLFVVRLEAPPLFLGRPLQDSSSSTERDARQAAQARLAKSGRVLPVTRGGVSVAKLGIGDRVEVIGTVARTIDRSDHFELGDGVRSIRETPSFGSHDDAIPYRRGPGASARLLVCDDSHPMILRDRSET